MVKGSQRFYEKAYPKDGKKKEIRSSFHGVYLLLKKYEIYREDAVFDLLPKGRMFLDIGCGEGRLVFKAMSKFKHVQGVDITKTRLSKARELQGKLPAKERNRVKFIHADVDGKLPFDDKYFDVISMVATLEHLFDPYRVIEEVKRILVPGGTIVIEVPNLAFLPRRIAVLMGKLPVTSEDETGWDGGHLHYFTSSSLRDLLIDYQFTIEKVICSGVFANIRSRWTSLLGGDIVIRAKKN